MPDSSPNRIKTGKSGAGQFTYKVNSEQDIDLSDDVQMTPKQRYQELEQRAREADLSSRAEIRKNPTFETFREQVEKHNDIIVEVLKNDSKAYGDDLVVPVKDFHHMIDLKLKSENPVPKELGGVRVNFFTKGEQRTIEINEEPATGRKISVARLNELAARQFEKLPHSKNDAFVFDSAKKQAEEGNAGCWAEYKLHKDKVQLSYAEVIYLPSRRSDFVENHGGETAIADGWL